MSRGFLESLGKRIGCWQVKEVEKLRNYRVSRSGNYPGFRGLRRSTVQMIRFAWMFRAAS